MIVGVGKGTVLCGRSGGVVTPGCGAAAGGGLILMLAAVRTAAALMLAIALAGCGDPVVILGDAPGVMRVVAGKPDDLEPAERVPATDFELSSPRGLALGADGTLYIADRRAARILAVRANGDVAVLADQSGCSGSACLRRPEGLALAPDGTLLAADGQAGRVFRVTVGAGSDGAVAVLAGDPGGVAPASGLPATEARFGEPTGVAVSVTGDVFVSDWPEHRVWRIARDGTLSPAAGNGRAGSSGDGGPATEARLRAPRGLAVADGRLYIADAADQRVRAVDLETGIIGPVAGSGTQGFSGDGGPALRARLAFPEAVVAVDGGATLFIADRGNGRVRAIETATGVIRTFAGNGASDYNGSGLEAGETALPAPAGLASDLGFLFIADDQLNLVWRTPIRF